MSDLTWFLLIFCLPIFNDGFYGIIGMEGVPNVNEAEMRELDAWIAKQDGLKGIVYATGATFKFSLDLNDFSLVKDAIEQRGWTWHSEYRRYRLTGYQDYYFRISEVKPCLDDELYQAVRILGEGVQSTEELAGCLAFKAAVEATSGGQFEKDVNLSGAYQIQVKLTRSIPERLLILRQPFGVE